MDDRIFVPDLLLVKLKSAVCNIESTQNSSKVNDTFSGLTKEPDELEPLLPWNVELEQKI